MQSIQSTLGDSISASLAEGLSSINDVIADLQAQVDSIASSDQAETISSTLGDVQDTLDELLASNNVFTGDLTINSDATLEFAESLGDRVKIINGTVTIEAPGDMDQARLQAVVDKIGTITQDIKVLAANSSSPYVNFDNLTGVGNITIAQPGSISFAALKSAKDITIGNNYESKLEGAVNFGALTQVNSFKTGEVAADYSTTGTTPNAIILGKASALNLGALTYYRTYTLTLEADKGADLSLGALESKDANGRSRNYTLNITGAENFTASEGLVKGSITVEDVTTVNLPAFTGTVNINAGVENVTMGALSNNFVGGTNDLLTVDLTANAADKAINLTGATSLLSAVIAGKIKTVTFSGNSDLETLDISAALESLEIHDTALTEAILTYTNSNLAKDASLKVTDNEDLASFSADAVDGLQSLTITGNPELETISFAALEAVPTGGNAVTVTIGGASAPNALNAADINQDAVGSTTGTFVTDSGLDGLKAYLTEAVKNNGSVLKVFFDSADTFTDGTSNIGNLKVATSAHVPHLTVMNRDSSSGATKSKRSYIIDPVPVAGPQNVNINGNTFTFTTLTGTTAGYVAGLNTADNIATVGIYGAVLSVSQYGAPEAKVTFGVAGSATISSSVTSATTMATAQYVKLQINQKDKSDADYTATIYLSTSAISDLTASSISASSNAHVSQITVTGATTVASITAALAAAFPISTAAGNGSYTVTETAATSATITIASKDKSPERHGRGVSLKISDSNLETLMGGAIVNLATTGDDKLLGTLPVVTFESNVGGDSIVDGGLSTIGNPGDAAGTGAGELTYAGTELTRLETGTQTLNNSSTAYVNFGKESTTGPGNINRTSWL